MTGSRRAATSPVDTAVTADTDTDTMIAAVHQVFVSAAAEVYLGEAVTVAEHQLRTAARARQAGAPAELVAAALLHDVGHVIDPARPALAEGIPAGGTGDEAGPAAAVRSAGGTAASLAFEHGVDVRHEEIGADWLARWFGPRVTEPVRLHVIAKRYLCAVDPDYLALLSPASIRTLALQGGPLTGTGLAAFRAGAYWGAAQVLRRWDDAGKDPLASVPPLAAYDDLLVSLLRGAAAHT
jgi:gamma-butyrobetaine dioxygenase